MACIAVVDEERVHSDSNSLIGLATGCDCMVIMFGYVSCIAVYNLYT